MLAEAIETTHTHSLTGLTGDRTACVTMRPCRAPQHTISDVGRIGGGQLPMPGEVSLAHHGILFLDDLPPFKPQKPEDLSQPPHATSFHTATRRGWRGDDCPHPGVGDVSDPSHLNRCQ